MLSATAVVGARLTTTTRHVINPRSTRRWKVTTRWTEDSVNLLSNRLPAINPSNKVHFNPNKISWRESEKDVLFSSLSSFLRQFQALVDVSSQKERNKQKGKRKISFVFRKDEIIEIIRLSQDNSNTCNSVQAASHSTSASLFARRTYSVDSGRKKSRPGESEIKSIPSLSTLPLDSAGRVSHIAVPELESREDPTYFKDPFVVETDRDKFLHEEIIKRQTAQKELYRRKTADNVNRALLGNVIICMAKLAAWASSGSSSMLSEFIHSVVDCGNQALLLVGLRTSQLSADRSHPYGYGKSVYFWALVSALGTFFLGAGVSMTHAVGDLINPSLQEITWQVWTVLAISFAVDGYVLKQTFYECLETKPPNVSYWKHFSSIRDPATLAILLEDGAACFGVVLAGGGIALTYATGNPLYDGLAGVSISALLGVMGLVLVHANHKFLLGQAVDREITDDIERILLSRRSIDSIRSVKSQWISSDAFSYKAEIDFDGTYLAAKLMRVYQGEFLRIRDSMDSELKVVLAFYAEDVMRTVEREVRHVEALIRQKYPSAEYIELEPMSADADRLAIFDVDNLERRTESDALNVYLESINEQQRASEKGPKSSDSKRVH